MVAALDADGRFAFWNTECERVTGYRSDEIVGNPAALKMLCPDGAEHGRLGREGLAHGAARRDWKWPFSTKDGQPSIVSWSVWKRNRVPGWSAWAMGADVTAHEAAESSAAQAHARLTDAVEALPFSFAINARDDRIVLINSKTREMLLEHAPLLKAGTPHRDVLRRSIEVGVVALAPEPDGSERIVHEQGEIVFGPDGEPQRMFGTVQDITERKRAERELRQSEQKFRNLVEGSLQGIAIIRNGKLLFVNRELCAMHGCNDPVELIGRDAFGATVVPEARERLLGYHLGRLRGEATPERYEFQGVRRDGRRIWIECRARVVVWEGSPASQVVYVEITGRKQYELALRRLAAAVEQTGDFIMISDPDGVIEYVNPAFERITGYTRLEAIGKLPSILKSGRQSAEFYQDVWATMSRGEVWKGRYVNCRKDGSFYEAESSISPIRDEQGEITNYVAVQRDVSVPASLEE